MSFLKNIKITNFRNHQYFERSFSKQFNVIIGQNGVGKTNILEAISLLSNSKGIKNAKNKEIMKDGVFPWGVNASFENEEGKEVTIGTAFTREKESESEKRIIKINGEKISKQSQLLEYVRICYLTPKLEQLFLQPKNIIREYLDSLVSIFIPEHTDLLGKYNYFKSERLKLLQSSYDLLWLKTIEKKLSEINVLIAFNRIDVIEKINNVIQGINSNQIIKKAKISIDGEVENLLINNKALSVENMIIKQLEQIRESDKKSFRSNFGIHKSEFVVILQEKNQLAQICSTGEQKALMLALTLSTAKAIEGNFVGNFSVRPIILLDEIASHLDSNKRELLFEELKSLPYQYFLTGVDEAMFDFIKDDAEFFEIS